MSSSSTSTLTAGGYLRLRREAYGLSLEEIANGLALAASRPAFLQRLKEIEADRDVATGHTLTALREFFSFSTTVYSNLAAGIPAGTALCRTCACSWNDPCGAGVHTCSWIEADLCSRCASGGKLTPRPEPVFPMRASDPHAIAMLSILAYLRLGYYDAARTELDAAITADARRRRGTDSDIRSGQDAAAIALDMTEWRDRAAGQQVAHA